MTSPVLAPTHRLFSVERNLSDNVGEEVSIRQHYLVHEHGLSANAALLHETSLG
jgi:hypothetical protein